MQTAWMFIQTSVIPAMDDLGQWLATNIPVAIQTAGNFWNNVMMPALQTAWEFIQANVIPTLGTLWQWLSINIPLAIQAVGDFSNNVLVPALQAVWIFIQTRVIPIIETLWQWLSTNVPLAIQTVSDFWNNILMPALTSVWNFISTSLMPLLGALVDVGLAIVYKATEALAGLWQNVLQPALAGVWSFINERVLPIFTSLWTFIQTNIGPVLGKLGEQTLPAISVAFGGISNAIQKAVDWLENLARSIRNLELPDWLTPGSPTPLENGVNGVSVALGSLNTAFGRTRDILRDELNRVLGGESGTIDDLKIVQGIAAGAIGTIGEKLQASFFIVRDGAAEAGSAVGGVWNGLNDIKNMNGLTTTITIITRHIDVYKGSVDGDGGGSGGGGGTPSPTPTATCFGSGTLVTMDDMTCKPIENVVVGDHVLSLDTGTGIKYSARVCDVFYHPMFEAQGYLIINGTLNVTPEHLLFVDGKWKRAGDMRAGDHMTGLDGEPMTVMCIHHIGASIPVYNLHTSHETHNYFANGVLAHNAKAYQHGGYVPSTGMAFLHAGEAVLSPKMVMGMLNVLSGLGSVASQTTINRVTNISVNPTYEQYASPATVYQDVAAALVAARM